MSDPSRPPALDRRHFLKVVGGGAAAGTLPVAAAAQTQHGATAHGAAHPPHAPAPASASPLRAFPPGNSSTPTRQPSWKQRSTR